MYIAKRGYFEVTLDNELCGYVSFWSLTAGCRFADCGREISLISPEMQSVDVNAIASCRCACAPVLPVLERWWAASTGPAVWNNRVVSPTR